jgi:outer membrane cobalamin receptor
MAAAQAQSETVVVYGHTPDKPFDRDTEVRLTGEQLAARGATDLATALALLPDVSVRDAGRGGFNLDIRGARKDAVSVLIDGELVTDPYYGTFDVPTIPITDIVEIRVSTNSQSPIDGPGGSGGVIDVKTRDAVGPRLVIARLTGDSLPTFGATATGRTALSRDLALRFSMSGLRGQHDYTLPMDASLADDRYASTGSARLEYRHGNRRLVVDGFLDTRHYISEPSDDLSTAAILLIDRETTGRLTANGQIQTGKLQLTGQAWVDSLYRRSRYFTDGTLATLESQENLSALRVGGMAFATHPIGREARWAVSAGIDDDSATVTESANNQTVSGNLALGELAGDLQYEHHTVRLDGSAGLALPFGVGAAVWPEAKGIVHWRPSYGSFELIATGSRKGSLPTLRDRFSPNGNPALGPEMITQGELRGIETIGDWLRVEVAPFYRHTSGTIRASTDPADMGKLINLGVVDLAGVDVAARVRVHPMVELGGAYDYIDAFGSTTGADPLDRLPHHRAEGWAQVTPYRRISILGRVRYAGTSIDQTQMLPAYTVIDATVTAPIKQDYLAVLRCDDLLDARPETRYGYHLEGRVVSIVLQGTWQ